MVRVQPEKIIRKLWIVRIGPAGEVPIIIRDTFVFLTYNGGIFTVKADPQEYNLLAEGKLPRGTYHTPPVYSRNRIYIRNVEGTLYCIDVSK